MPNKKYTVIVSDRAASMLVNHVRFLARVSPEAAKKLHNERRGDKYGLVS